MSFPLRHLGIFLGVLLGALLVPALASAGLATQGGADMVVINPGGGQAADGSDGIQPVFNGASGYRPSGAGQSVPTNGADQQFYKDTGQWCCSTGSGPNINVGGLLVGNSNVAGRSSSTAANWTLVEIVATSGSAVRVPAGSTTLPSTPTGSGAATIRYTYTTSGLDYVMLREIKYRYPSNYFSETYTFTIPSTNSAEVKFYQGGDAAPGDDDTGSGMMTTSPARTLYEINDNSSIFIAYSENDPATSPFDFWFVGSYSTPRSTYISGGNLSNVVETSSHDAGLNMQWNLGSTPGTYERSMRTMVGTQGINLEVGFAPEAVASAGTSDLEIQIVNTSSSAGTGMSYSYTLPAGLTVAGAESNTCGGTLTVVGSLITLTGVDVNSGANCLVTIPVTGADGRYTVSNQDFTTGGGLNAGVGQTALTIGNPTFPVTASKSGSGAGTITSAPAGINCGTDCTETWPVDEVVTLTATADPGSVFSGWSGDIGSCTPSSTTCQITVEAATNITAQFAVGRELTVNKTGAGTVTSAPAGIDCGATCNFTFADNASITLTAAASPGSVFAGWSGDAGSCTTATTCTLTMDQARSVNAQFLPTRTLTVTRSGVGTGTVTSAPAGINCGVDCTEEIADGTIVTLTAAPDAGMLFGGWSGDAGSCGADPVCAVTMDQARTVNALFLIGKELTVTRSGAGKGIVTSNPAGIDCGTTCNALFPDSSPVATSLRAALGQVTLTATPDENSVFSKWSGDIGDCAPTEKNCTVSMDQARTVDAEFLPLFELKVTKTGEGTVSSTPAGIDCGADCTEKYLTETKVTLQAAPSAGHEIKSWGGACSGAAATCEIVMSEAKNVSIEFIKTASGKPDLHINIGGLNNVTAGKPFRVGVRVTNRGDKKPTPVSRSVTAENLNTCLRIPDKLIIVRAAGGEVYNNNICWSRGSLAPSKWVSYKPTLVAPSSFKGSISFRASVNGSGQDGAAATAKKKRPVKVKEAKPTPPPYTPTG